MQKNTDEVSKERFRLPSPCSRRVRTRCGTVRAAARGRRKNERFSPIFRRVRHRHSLCRHYRICRCCRRCAEAHRQQVFQQPNQKESRKKLHKSSRACLRGSAGGGAVPRKGEGGGRNPRGKGDTHCRDRNDAAHRRRRGGIRARRRAGAKKSAPQCRDKALRYAGTMPELAQNFETGHIQGNLTLLRALGEALH